MSPTNAVAPELFERLLAGPAESRAAWLDARRRLRSEPESIAEPLCAFLLESIVNGGTVAVGSSILPALEVCTRDRPELLPAALLDRLLARASALDTLSVVCLGLMRARTDAEGLITEGIQDVLAATEHALVPQQDAGLQDVQDYARDIAVELWETVAERDPMALVVVLGFWTAANGWDRPSTRLFLELLLRVSPHRPDVRDALIEALESVRAALAAAGNDATPADRTLEALHEQEERTRRSVLASSIISELAAEGSAGEPVGSGAASSATPARLEQHVARWKEEYLSDDPDRSLAARERLGPETEASREGMVNGVVQAAEELFAVDPWDDRFGPLVHFLCRTAEASPELVPSGVLERWTRADSLEGWELAMVYATLAQVDPRALVDRHLAGALSAAAAVGGSFGSTILAGIGRTDPALLIAFASGWLESEGWTPDVGPAIACAFEQVAREHPDLRTRMIQLLRAHAVTAPRDGGGVAEFSRCIDRLAGVAAEGDD